MHRILIGAYTEPMPHVRGAADGIYCALLDPASGRIEVDQIVRGPRNPSYVAWGPGGRNFYAVQETVLGDDPALWAFAWDSQKRSAAALNHVPSRGGEPCHVSVDPKGRHVFVANYGTGSALSFPLGPDGEIIDLPKIVQHRGSGPNPRQEGPHVHAALPSPSGDHLIVCDLGCDLVTSYRVSDAGLHSDEVVSQIRMPPGSGPRQAVFAPDGRSLLVVSEFSARLDTLRFDQGQLRHQDSVSMLPTGWTGTNLAAAVAVHPSGKLIYCTNRGHDSIAIFSASESGTLESRGWQTDGVEFSRDIAIDPSGTFLLAANQNRNEVVTFAIDDMTGKLRPTGHVLGISSPSCIAFLR